MIIVRSPLRISLGGGGTDLSSYYREHGGFLIAAAIDKYVYVNVMRPFTEGIFLKYSELERVDSVSKVKHKIIREALRLVDLADKRIEVTTLADIPSGTGLGSSGSFTTALLRALYAYDKRYIQQEELAKLACHLEIDRLAEPIGKQDQYISAIGGLTCFSFHQNDTVTIEDAGLSRSTIFDLEENLLLFFTGFSRSASEILEDQNTKSRQNNKEMLENLHTVKDMGLRSKDALRAGDLSLFGELMHEHWENKKRRSSGMTNGKINEWYELGVRNGAVGGKLVGAGGGGFLMFLAEDKKRLRHCMAKSGLEEVRFRFDFEGTKVLFNA